MPYIFGKLWHLAIIWPIRKAFQCILQGVRILLAKYTRISPTSDNESYLVFVLGVMGKFYLVNWSRGQGGREDCNYRLSDASRDYLRALLFSLPESSALRSRSSTSLNLFTAPGDHTFCYDCGVDDYFDNYDEFDDEPLSVYRKHRVIVNGYVW